MGKVNLKELEEKDALAREKELKSGIQEKVIAGRKLFKGPVLEDWYDDFGDCLTANADAKRQAGYKKDGLDEFGRTPEQVLLNKRKVELLKKKQAILKQVSAIDKEISALKLEDIAISEKEKKK